MEWKSKIEDECCADELEEMIVNQVKAGFCSDDDILEDCVQYIEDFYSDLSENLTEADLLEIIQALRQEHQCTGEQKNFLKLDRAFRSLIKRGIIALHYAGYTQSDGFEDCNEAAEWFEEKGGKAVGCCFYTEQDLEHLLNDSAPLHISFGNYLEKPTAEEIGQAVADELSASGFCVEWNETAETKIAIKDIEWDKYYTEDD